MEVKVLSIKIGYFHLQLRGGLSIHYACVSVTMGSNVCIIHNSAKLTLSCVQLRFQIYIYIYIYVCMRTSKMFARASSYVS